jgi:hypothetical protein
VDWPGIKPEGIHSFNSSTRIVNESSIAIDNIFVDKSRNYNVCPLINGLSVHDAQLIVFDNVIISNQATETYFIRNINRFTRANFQIQLSYENWENVFSEKAVNCSFNNLLDTYLRLFDSSFSKKKS